MTRCRKCRRVLKNTDAIRKGIGPICERKEAAEKGRQKDDGSDIIEAYDGGSIWIERVAESGRPMDTTSRIRTNVAQSKMIHGGGFNFGYAGSGPADWAHNILRMFCKSPQEAELLHQSFKWKFVAVQCEDRLEISREDIENFIVESGAELKERK